MVILGINTSSIKNFFQLIGVLIIFLFVLIITYITTKWIAKYQQGMVNNKNIQVIETFRVTNNKYIQIVEIGTKYLAIAVCKDSIQVLTELEKEQLIWMPPDNQQLGNDYGNFQELLQKLKEKIPKK